MNQVIVVLIDSVLMTLIGVLAVLYLPHPSKVCVTSTHQWKCWRAHWWGGKPVLPASLLQGGSDIPDAA